MSVYVCTDLMLFERLGESQGHRALKREKRKIKVKGSEKYRQEGNQKGIEDMPP